MTQIREFTLTIPDTDLTDLHDRLTRTRLPNRLAGGAAPAGDVDPELVQRLLTHWREEFDWRAAETRINALPQVLVEVDGRVVHAVHARAEQPTGVPVVLVHGWPDSFLRYQHVVPRLLAAGHDVVVPSLPGFGFSDQPERATAENAAEAVHGLVTALGHERYAVHGGDWGSAVADALAVAHPDAVVALHLSDVPFHKLFSVDKESTEGAERAFLDTLEGWGDDAVYFTVQGKQPMTLSYGLTDSPVGLLAWHGEKYAAWSDRDPDPTDVLTQVALTWFTGTAWSGMRFYAEQFAFGDEAQDWSGDWSDDSSDGAGSTDDGDSGDGGWGDGGSGDGGWGAPERVEVPTGFAIFPADIGVPPRELADRLFDVRRFTLMPRGGHFGAMEEPELLAADLTAFLAEVAPSAGE